MIFGFKQGIKNWIIKFKNSLNC